jgi:membrane protein implicated in regulation of membrane protease activity
LGVAFWIRRFFLVWFFAGLIIGGAQLLKGHTLKYAALQGLLWSTISALIFTVSRFFRSRQGQHCAICKDTPEMQADHHEPPA